MGANFYNFLITDNTTKLVNSNNAVTHKASGTSGNNSKSWSVDWTPTASSSLSTTFYATLMFANGNNNTSGDQVYTLSLSVQEAQNTALNDSRIELDHSGRWSVPGEIDPLNPIIYPKNTEISPPLMVLTHLAQAVMRKRRFGYCPPVFTEFNIVSLNNFEAIALLDLIKNVSREENIQFIIGMNSNSEIDSMVENVKSFIPTPCPLLLLSLNKSRSADVKCESNGISNCVSLPSSSINILYIRINGCKLAISLVFMLFNFLKVGYCVNLFINPKGSPSICRQALLFALFERPLTSSSPRP